MSPPRKDGPTAEEMLARIHDLESDMADAALAAGVVWDLLESLFDRSQLPELTNSDRKDLYSLDPGKVDRLHYAVADSRSKAENLKDNLLAGLGYSP